MNKLFEAVEAYRDVEWTHFQPAKNQREFLAALCVQTCLAHKVAQEAIRLYEEAIKGSAG